MTGKRKEGTGKEKNLFSFFLKRKGKEEVKNC